MILTGGYIKRVTQSNAAYKLVAKDGIEPPGPKALGYEPRVLPLHTTSPNLCSKSKLFIWSLSVLPLNYPASDLAGHGIEPRYLPCIWDNPNNAAFKTLT